MSDQSSGGGGRDSGPGAAVAHEGTPAYGLEELATTRYERVAVQVTRDSLVPVPGPAVTVSAPGADDAAQGILPDLDDPLAELHVLAAQKVGHTISERYKLERLMGTGAAGAVYAAYDAKLDRRVALKILHEGLRTSEEQVVRFRREAQAASSIGHSSIVAIFDVGQDGEDGAYYMVMELLKGEALFYAIVDGKLDDDDIREAGRQLFDALAAAHARGIIHRDVKPENIFLTHDLSGAMRIKLLDFGIAKFIRTDMGRSFATMDGLLIGTPHYMSPEVCTGAPVDEYADLWAAAGVLFTAFAGRPPFDDAHIGKLLMKIVREPSPSLAVFRPDLPKHLITAIDRGLSRDRNARFTTARQFADALSAGVADVGGLDWDDMD